MKIHIIAPDGLLGSCATKYFKQQEGYEAWTYGRPGSSSSLNINTLKPAVDLHWVNKDSDDDIVLNCLGVLKPTIKEVGSAETIIANALFPQLLSDLCERRNARVIHISSDCVFSGNLELNGSYVETDAPDATDVYGRTKSFVPEYGMTLRTSFIGPEDRENPRGLMQWVLNHRHGATIEGYTNCWWNGMTCYQLMKCIRTVIEDDLYDNGLYHIHTPAKYSKKGICAWIDHVYDLGLNIESVKATNIMGTKIEEDGHLNRTLGSIYGLSADLDVPPLVPQIEEQKQWHESQL